MRLAWVTDPHLGFVPGGAARALGEAAAALGPPADAMVITGDVGECDTFAALLGEIHAGFGRPVFFVLGNHDYYRGSLARAHEQAKALDAGVRWLRCSGVVALGAGVCLVGHDGFYDARAGDVAGSRVVLNDFLLVEELREAAATGDLVAFVRSLADRGAGEAEQAVRSAVAAGYGRVVFATHVPPFAAASFHEDGLSDPDHLPWFTNVAMGEALLRVAADHPRVRFLVLCGHTHTGGTFQAAPNLRVLTGGAQYGRPRIEGVLELTRTG